MIIGVFVRLVPNLREIDEQIDLHMHKVCFDVEVRCLEECRAWTSRSLT